MYNYYYTTYCISCIQRYECIIIISMESHVINATLKRDYLSMQN